MRLRLRGRGRGTTRHERGASKRHFRKQDREGVRRRAWHHLHVEEESGWVVDGAHALRGLSRADWNVVPDGQRPRRRRVVIHVATRGDGEDLEAEEVAEATNMERDRRPAAYRSGGEALAKVGHGRADRDLPVGDRLRALSVFEGEHRVDGGRVDVGARSDGLADAGSVRKRLRQIGRFARRRLLVELKGATGARVSAARHKVGKVAERGGGDARLSLLSLRAQSRGCDLVAG